MIFPKLGMVIAAGGAGVRFGSRRNKLLVEYRGEPILLHSLRTFSPVIEPRALVVAAPAALLDVMRELVDQALPGNGVVWCVGGATRIASTVQGIKALPDHLEWVAVHDAARPLASVELLAKLHEQARMTGGAIPGVTPVDTIKALNEDGSVSANLVRKNLAAVATPQLFDFQKYMAALSALPSAVREGKIEDPALTDDAAVFMRGGFQVKVVFSSEPNPKITVPDDLGR